MNNRISIKKVEDKIVNGRRQSHIETDFYNCWSEVLSLYGEELYEAINVKLENTVKFRIRYCKKAEELAYKDKFIVCFKGHKYKIYYVDFMKYDKKYVVLKCNEVL